MRVKVQREFPREDCLTIWPRKAPFPGSYSQYSGLTQSSQSSRINLRWFLTVCCKYFKYKKFKDVGYGKQFVLILYYQIEIAH